MSRPSTTNPREAGVCLPPLVGPLGLPRVRVGRLQKGRLVGPEDADAVASVARAAQRGRWSRPEPPGGSQESGSEDAISCGVFFGALVLFLVILRVFPPSIVGAVRREWTKAGSPPPPSN